MSSNRIDLLKLYFGDPYPINDDITILQPSIQDLVEYGENEFFSMLNVFIGTTTSCRLNLWKSGIDWNKISDYELFCNVVRSLTLDETKILFGDIDFQKFEIMKVELPDGPWEPPEPDPNVKLSRRQKLDLNFKKFEMNCTFYNAEQEIEIDATTYHFITQVLREMVHIYPKTEYAFGKETKKLIIQEEEMKLAQFAKENDGKPTSTLQPLISACVNHPGFKYKTNELKEIGINQFMDSVKRLQIYESTRALLGGSYSGFCDTSKIPREQFDFMRDLKQ